VEVRNEKSETDPHADEREEVRDIDVFGKVGQSGALAAVALAVALAAGGYALASAPSGSSTVSGTVEVTGNGTVTVVPDTLTITMAITTVRATTKAALARNSTESRAVEQAFFTAGVAKRDVTTSNLTVGEQDNSQGRKIGYAAAIELTATLRQLAKSGAVITAAEDAAGNDVSISGITYSLANPAQGESAARSAAMDDALARAKGFASAAGERVGQVVKISDTSSTSVPEPFASANAVGTARGASAVPLQPGTQTATASVDVVFSLVH
jgi:uncharacterized protein YggE